MCLRILTFIFDLTFFASLAFFCVWACRRKMRRDRERRSRRVEK
jgi:hypothetical protein